MTIAKWIFPLLCLLASSAATSCPTPDCVRIGSWNIAWLGSEKREQSTDAAVMEDMARMIADDWSIDLISLEEINTSIDGQQRGEQYSTKQWQQLKKALEARGYKTLSGTSGNAQRIVFAWRKPVVARQVAGDMAVPDSYLIDEYCRSSNLRKPMAGLFQAGHFDFWAIGLHLKSGYGGNAACANAVREMQTHYIVKQMEKLKTSDKDIILLGDFNASSSHKSLQNIVDYGFVALTDKPARDKASGSRTQGAGKRGSVIDLIMVDKNNTGEWIRQSTVLFKPENPERFSSLYSDHVPVWADFKTGSDDD